MNGAEDNGWGRLTTLVVDEHAFQRSITLDQLRLANIGRVLGAPNFVEAWQLLLAHQPDVLLMEWMGADMLDFVRKVRTNQASPTPTATILLLTSQSALAHVEAARNAGVDACLRKPITGYELKQRVSKVRTNSVPFIKAAGYVGPCRRRRADTDFAGPWKRLDDAVAAALDDEDDDFDPNVQLARGYVAALEARTKALGPGDERAARGVFRALKRLEGVAEQIQDEDLALATREMSRFLKSLGAGAAAEPEVLRTHAAALTQLVYVPRSRGEERKRVALSLKKMVEKKLRQMAPSR
jgi:CheY-like chemotaxis protein